MGFPKFGIFRGNRVWIGPIELPNILNAQGHPENVRPKKGSTRLPSKETEDLPSRHPNMPLRLPSSIIRADGRTTKSIGRDESTKRQSEPSAGSSSRLKVLTQSDRAMVAARRLRKKSHSWSLSGCVKVLLVPGPAWILLYKT